MAAMAAAAVAKRMKLGPRVNRAQMEILISFLEDNQHLASATTGGFDSLDERQKKDALWDSVTEALNAAGDAKKNRAEWRRFWSGKKKQTKDRVEAIGSGVANPLTDLERRIVALISVDGEACIEQHATVNYPVKVVSLWCRGPLRFPMLSRRFAVLMLPQSYR